MGRDARRNPFLGRKPGDGAIPPVTAKDRAGRDLQVGDTVYLINTQGIDFRVQEVKPVLDPGAPAGLVQITFVAVFITGVPGGQPLGDVILLRRPQLQAAAASDEEQEGDQQPDPESPPAEQIGDPPEEIPSVSADPPPGPRRIEE